MERFFLGQSWVMRDPSFGTFFGEVIEVCDDGRRGVVLITDGQGNEIDTFEGNAADFQASGEWELVR